MIESTKEVDASLEASFENTNSWRITMIVTIITIIVGALLLGFIISKSIINPIKKLQNISSQVVQGN